MSQKMTKPEMARLIKRAEAAAAEAFAAARPTPMVVGTPRNLMGSLTGGDDGGLDPSQPIYNVPEGPCGFAWVTVRPGTSRFARYLRSRGLSRKGYYGGEEVWYGDLGIPASQSYERNIAAASAYARVLREAGIQASSGGRLD